MSQPKAQAARRSLPKDFKVVVAEGSGLGVVTARWLPPKDSVYVAAEGPGAPIKLATLGENKGGGYGGAATAEHLRDPVAKAQGHMEIKAKATRRPEPNSCRHEVPRPSFGARRLRGCCRRRLGP